MEERRRQIAEDLADVIDGDVRIDRASVALYSTDASLFEIEPAAVVCPRTATDVEKLAAWSVEQRIPLTPRGSGTGLAGGALGSGVIVDFSRYMNRVVSISEDQVRVQPGVLREQLNRQLRTIGRYYAPDPSNSRITTIGGMLAVDAAGSHAVRIGSARDHIASIECVLSGGQRLELSRERLSGPDPGTPQVVHSQAGTASLPGLTSELSLAQLTPATRRADLLSQLVSLLRSSEELIRRHQPPLIRNCSGYMLRSVLEGETLDLPRLLAGSEGTLALFTEATLYTLPIPDHRSAAMLMFASLEDAVRATQLILPMDPSACDLLDRRLLSLGRGADERLRDAILPEAEAGLIVEFTGEAAGGVLQRLQDLQKLLRSEGLDFRVTRTAGTFEEAELLWSLPARVVSLLASLRGDSRPLPFIEDVALPPEQLAPFLQTAQRIFQQHEVTATLYAHAASGQLHFRPILPVPSRNEPTKLMDLASDLYSQVTAAGGTISGEHGDGLSRTPFIRSQYGPLYSIFEDVKRLFDPLRLLNPDKIVAETVESPLRWLRHHRPAPRQPESDDAPLLPVMQLNWSAQDAAAAAVRCNGCGSCRVKDSAGRMCPFVTEGTAEDLAPRAKAALLRQAICADGSADLLQHESIRPVIESCFNCKQCQLECPSEVDIPRIVLEARAQFVRAQGLTRTQWLLSRVHTWAPLLSRIAPLANPLLRSRPVRRLLERLTGLAAARRLPPFARTSFLNSSRVRRPDNSATPGTPLPTVVYFVDYFANFHDPELAEAFCRVLEHNGYRVYVPPHQTVSGMSMVSAADFDAARNVAEHNLRELAEPASEGYPILCTEPSAALCIAREYPLLTNREEADVVARKTLDAGSFLLDLHRTGKLRRDFTPLPMKLAWHTPCHIRALGPEAGLRELLLLIPQLQIIPLEKGCTGMAGTFGLAARNFQRSLEIGHELMQTIATIDAVAGTTDCSSCRMQMEQQASIPTIHPIKLLALSYGLMPRLAERLKQRPAGLSMAR